MNEAEAAAQPQVRSAAEGLARIQTLLQEVAANLPETVTSEDEAPLRSVIECVLVDSLQPAIDDLRAALSGDDEAER
jgi:uncharacterized protein (DUF885 family)